MSESSDIDTGPSDGEEVVASPLKKQKHRHFTGRLDQKHSDVMSETESRRTGLKEYFLDARNLEAPPGPICFHKLDQPSHYNKHYLVDHMKATRLGTAVPQSARPIHSIAESNPGKRLFEKRLTSTDIKYRLGIPKKHAEEYFPCLKIGERAYKEEIVQFSDAQNENWQMKFSFSPTNVVYMIRGEWKKFVSTQGLKAGDRITFYKPKGPLADNRHFSIRCVKEGENSRNDQSATPGNEPKPEPFTETRVGLGTRLFGRGISGQIECESHAETDEDDTERSVGGE